MLNNKGQSLIIFVLCLPIILLFLTYVVDMSRVNYEKSRLKNIMDSSKVENQEEICNIVLKNDKDIICEIKNNTLFINKRIKSLFGKIIGNEYYDIKVSRKL